jgi:hypothetical protein
VASTTKAQLAAEVEALRSALERESAQRARVEEKLTEAVDQRAATSEILRVISTSPADAQPVFEAIVRNAARLCDAEFSAVARFDDGLLHLVALNNMSPEETKVGGAAQGCRPGRGLERPPVRHCRSGVT